MKVQNIKYLHTTKNCYNVYHRVLKVSLRNICLFRLCTAGLHMKGSTVHNQNKNNSSESETNSEWSKS